MAHLADLTPYRYMVAPDGSVPELDPGSTTPGNGAPLAIGWLSEGQPYSKGPVEPEVLAAIKKLCFRPVRLTFGLHPCDLCGAAHSYLDEVIVDDAGGRMFVCSDTDFCAGRQARGHVGRLNEEAAE